MNHPETSIIIRTRNEEKWIEECLKRILSQNYNNFEVIIIDSGSKDKTLEIAKSFPVRIILILPQDFSYPRALNIAIRESKGTKYIAILSAHSLPINSSWLLSGISHFKNHRVAGVYGPLLALPNSTFWDYYFHTLSYCKEFIMTLPRLYRVVSSDGLGVLGFTNAIIRRDLWREYQFNEKFGLGGEDGDWARYFINKDFVLIKDLNFAVRHSHNLNLSGWKKQWSYWSSLTKPQPFSYLSFRKNKTHAKDVEDLSDEDKK
jgi:rhamnosyltransferase